MVRELIPSTSDRGEIDRLRIDIEPGDYRRLASQREAALAKYYLDVGEEDFVPATLIHEGRELEAKARLKGDWIDHFDSPKWSLRIQMRGDDTLFGMSRFSIQHPKTRNYIYEWVYHQALRREEVLGLRYDFIDVTQNGSHLGIYALEEHFAKELLEHNGRADGPIVRFNEDLMFKTQIQFRPFREVVSRGPLRRAENTATSTTVDSYLGVDLDTFETSRMTMAPETHGLHDMAIHLLEAFRRGEVDTSGAFDIGKLARFFAISDLVGSRHAYQWRNLRFYYNPTTSRLEPIGFDGDAGFPTRALAPMIDADYEARAPIGERRAIFLKTVFSDLAFFAEYVRALERVAEDRYLEDLLAELGSELDNRLKLLQREFPAATYSRDVFFRNREYIRTALYPIKAIQAYLVYSGTDRIELQLGNIQALPIEILGISVGGSPFIDPEQMIVLPGAQVVQPRPVDYRLARFDLPMGFARTVPSGNQLKVLIRLLGTNNVREIDVFDWPLQSAESVAEDLLRQAPTHRTFDFLVTDETAREILVKPGRWRVDRDLIIPGGYRVIAAEGTELDLTNAAAIVSYSPLDWVGGEEDPIFVRSVEGSGQGIVVMKAGAGSVLRHVVFDNLAAPSRDHWSLTGAVTFYESAVEMSHVTLTAGRSEDALHIVRSQFEIEETLFANAASDALDVDFGEGTMVGTRFVNSGNDAVDVSGSHVEMSDIAVTRAGDKGLSAGERSTLTATGVEIEGAEIAVASKDDSIVTIFDLRISEGDIGLVAFRKKPEFGPGAMVVHGLESSNLGRLYLVEKESSLSVDGQSIPGTETGLREVLY